jgi:glutathione S-transferase
VDPQRLTAVREAYDRALDELEPQLDQLLDAGFIRTPWLGDNVSNAVVAHYNRTVMESDLGTFQAMQRYSTELKAIRDQFAQMEQAYIATETANTNLPRRVE